MRRTPITRGTEKVPVMKNIIYASKLLFELNKSYMLWHIVDLSVYLVFKNFFQTVLFLRTMLNIIEGDGDFGYYFRTLLLFFAIGIVYELISDISDYKCLVGEKKIFKALNNKIFEKAYSVDISCYEDPEFYDKYQRAVEILTSSHFTSFSYSLSSLIGNFISFVSVIGVVLTIDPSYLIFLAPILFVFIIEILKSKLLYKRDLQMTKNNRTKAYAQRTVFLKDFSKDIRTSNIFSVIIGRFNRAIKSNIEILKKYGVKMFVYSMIGSVLGEFIPTVGSYALAGYQFAYTGNLSVSGFSVVLSSINSIRSATFSMADCFAGLSTEAFYFQNLRIFFEYESRVVPGEREPETFESLELKDVSFKYPGAKNYSLKNVNLKLYKGETAAIVGINGAGKTTLVKLLLRFYDVDEGEILYNGRNIKEYNPESLRRKFSTVFQDYKTFAVSVNENVMCKECTEEDKIIAERAMRQSGVYDKIVQLPDGADTVLTREFDENGAGLSGGEAQKTAVSRMFAGEFDIAILDEPSSALDPIAEYKMYENLIAATKDKTVIYISHRLSSAVLSDNVFVLSAGTVIESGSHAQLMEKGGEYAKMFTLQASGYNRKEDLDDEKIS